MILREVCSYTWKHSFLNNKYNHSVFYRRSLEGLINIAITIGNVDHTRRIGYTLDTFGMLNAMVKMFRAQKKTVICI